MRIHIAPKAAELLGRLNRAGFEAYAVGGCVRDSLLGKVPQDWDFCTSATPEEIKTCFAGERTILTGEKYGTVTVLLEGEPFEITTFRAEAGYGDNRHPDSIRFLSSLQEDLARRDFTINAMAADANGMVTDCFGGIADLESGLIRCVGLPRSRFEEDALRMLRGLRFAARLGFSLEKETAAAIGDMKDRLLFVAPERLRKELEGLLCGKAASQVLRSFPQVIFTLIPELAPCKDFCQYNYHHVFDVWEHSLRVLENCKADPVLRLAALLHDVGKPSAFFFDKHLVGHFYGHSTVSAALSDRILCRLHYDNDSRHKIVELIALHSYPIQGDSERPLRRLLSRIGPEQTGRFLELRRGDRLGKGTEKAEQVEGEISCFRSLLQQMIDKELCFSLRQLALDGNDLMRLGVPQGKQIGALLAQLLEAVMEDRIPNDPVALSDYAQSLLQEREND